MLDKSSVDKARLLYYGLLSKFFIFNATNVENIDDTLTIIYANPLDFTSKDASSRLLETLDSNGFAPISKEYDAIFNNPNNNPLKTTVSFYEEGIEFGKKCIQTKELLQKTKIRRDEKNYKEPEDSFGFLMVFMYEMVKSVTNGDTKSKNIQFDLFKNIINPAIDLFIDDMFNHPKSKHYKDIAIIANAFMEFERVYFEVEKPPLKKRVKKEHTISATEAKRRALNKAKKEADRLKNKT